MSIKDSSQLIQKPAQRNSKRESIRNVHYLGSKSTKEFQTRMEIEQIEEDSNVKSKEYMRRDLLVYSAAFEEMIKQQQCEKDGNSQTQANTILISKMIDQVEQQNLKLESPEVLQILKLIMKKPNYRRNEKEKLYIWKYMQKNPFFQKMTQFYPENVMLELCRNMQVEEYNATQRVFSQGEIGKKFYVVLQGQTAAFSKVKRIAKENLFSIAISRMLFQMIKQEFGSSPLTFPDVCPIKKILYMFPDQIMIGSHQKGQYFGEIALRNDCPRTASIFAKTNIILAIIQAVDYRSFEDLQLQQSIGFLKNLSIFQHFKQTNLQEIWYLCVENKYERGQEVYIEDSNATHIYLIRDGEVQISIIAENNIKETKQTHLQPQKLININGAWSQQLAEKRKEKVVIATLGDCQYFGELELLANKNSKRITRATCLTQSKIYSISKKQLIHLFNMNGLQKEFRQIFSLRSEIYNNYTEKAMEERNKRRIFKLEDKIDLNKQDKEGIKLNFNKLRLFSHKCQFIQQHMEKVYMVNVEENKEIQQNTIKESQDNQIIWKEKKEEDEEFKTFLSSNLVTKMMQFFKDHKFGEIDNTNTSFLNGFLKKTKNPHLVRLELMWKQFKKGKPSLKESQGKKFEDYFLKPKQNIDILNTSTNVEEINKYKNELFHLLKKRNMIEKQTKIESLSPSNQGSKYSNFFRKTNESNNMNFEIDEVIISPDGSSTPNQMQRRVSIFNNTQVSGGESSTTSKQSRKYKQINLEEDQYVIPSCYNYGMNQIAKQEQKNSPKFKIDNSISMIQRQRGNSIADRSSSILANRDDTNFTLPVIAKNQSLPHFIKIQKKSNKFKEEAKSYCHTNKLKII